MAATIGFFVIGLTGVFFGFGGLVVLFVIVGVVSLLVH